MLQPRDLRGAFTALEVGRQVRLDQVPGPRGNASRFGREGGWKGGLRPSRLADHARAAGGRVACRRVQGRSRGEDRTAAFFTDARNGRGSGDPTSTQPGRNPICEQSDVFFDTYSSAFGGNGARGNSSDSNVFLVAPCPTDIKDHRQHW